MTARQLQCLEFVRRYIAQNGYPPALQEIQRALDIASRSGAHRLLVALERRRKIRRVPGQARAIELIDERAEQLLAECLTALLARPEPAALADLTRRVSGFLAETADAAR